MGLAEAVDAEARRSGFSGVVRVDRAGETLLEVAYGRADRAHGIDNTVSTRFGTASITKGLTALTVMALVERGVLTLDAPVRSWLADDLPLVSDAVTIEHLLAHRSGIGDYLDEVHGSDVAAHVLPVPVHRLDRTEAYLPLLDGRPPAFGPGSGFAYNDAGYVVLALVAERASGTSFADLVLGLVCEPAGMSHTAFLRSDELPGDAAVGYLDGEGPRTNVLHLPVVGSGDGGVYSTVADLHALWAALHDGRIVSPVHVAEMLVARSDWPEEDRRYGLGFHLHATRDAAFLEGYDAGVSALTIHEPSSATTGTVISNWSRGAWPLYGLLEDQLG